MTVKMATRVISVLVFKGETQINDQLTGYGRWEAEFAGNKAESDTAQQKNASRFCRVEI